MDEFRQSLPPGHPGDQHRQPVAPVSLQKWGALASNLAVCGACVWVLVTALFFATERSEFAAAIPLITAVEALFVFSLFSAVRKLERWPGTHRLHYYQFALAFGGLTVAITIAVYLYRWIKLLIQS